MLFDLVLALGLWRLFKRPKPVPVLHIILEQPVRSFPENEKVKARVVPLPVHTGRRRLLRNGGHRAP